MKVHVVITAYDPDASLVTAVRGALDQTHSDVLVTVVDDHSDNDVWAMLSPLAADPRLRYARLSSNLGPGTARNAGLLLGGRTQVVTFHDDDDVPAPRKIELQHAALQAPKNIDDIRRQTIARELGTGYDAVVTRVLRRETDGSTAVSGDLSYLVRDVLPNAYPAFGTAGRKYSLHFVSTLFRKTVFADLGGFLDGMWYEDNEMAVRTVLGGINYAFIAEPLYEFIKSENSITYHTDATKVQRITEIYHRIQAMRQDAMVMSQAGFRGKYRRSVDSRLGFERIHNLTAADFDDTIPAPAAVTERIKSQLHATA